MIWRKMSRGVKGKSISFRRVSNPKSAIVSLSLEVRMAYHILSAQLVAALSLCPHSGIPQWY
jgi:hypothetical protein